MAIKCKRLLMIVLLLYCTTGINGTLGKDQNKPSSQKPSASKSAHSTITLQVATTGDQLIFNKTKLSASPGALVQLTFKNTASASSGLQHNLVITKPGKADEIATAGIIAGPEKAYVPDSPDVIANTKLLTAGQSETIQFKAPAQSGDYPFICTFPGHASTMRGILTVK